jgi:hypothetical protein
LRLKAWLLYLFFGAWILDIGIYSLELGFLYLKPGTWLLYLFFGAWILDPGIYSLDLGTCDLIFIIGIYFSMYNAICTTHKKDIPKNCPGVLKP